MAVDGSVPRSRRAVLVGGLGGLFAGVVQSLVRPSPVRANDPNDVVKGVINHTTNRTSIVNDSERGTAFEAHADGTGMIVTANSDTGVGISVSATQAIVADGEVAIIATGLCQGIVAGARVAIPGTGEDVGVQGTGSVGIQGTGDDAGVLGDSALGHAIRGASSSSDHPAILGWSTASLTGIQGYSAPGANPPGSPPAKTGLYGYAAQDASAVGVRGESTVGRGGRFKGNKAQIRLDPSSAATHPASGAKGDLFVDASGRLWFCKGSTTWVQLA
jgi:hypothetical protein